jgi:general stress protein 26
MRYQKHLVVVLTIFHFFSCNIKEKEKSYRQDFTQDEQAIIDTSLKIINDCYYGTLISIDEKGQPRARVMEPFAPESDFTIWLATNPKSRKVNQIKNNPKVSMHYFDKSQMGYVSLMGKATLVNDSEIKSKIWKEGWEKFYKNKEDAYLLICFIPESLEIISFPNAYNGNKDTWQPHRVLLRD